ncbi:MAG: class I SAM-dependent methyltransferase [Promethearchaeota archaeon]
MAYFYIAFLIIGIILIIFLVLGLPRKKNARKPSIEGLDDPEVAKAFEKMTNLVPFKILRRRILSELKKYNPEGKLVDLGCGSGNLLVLISKKYPNLELIGVDISSEILELARLKTQDNELTGNVDFKVGSADNLPFPDNSVDFIISSLSLHHWKDPSIVLKETHRVLKHNGVLEIFDFRRDSRKFFYGLLTFATKVVVPKPLKKIKEPIGSLQAGYTPIEIKELISNSPFKNEEIEFYLAWMFIKMIKG